MTELSKCQWLSGNKDILINRISIIISTAVHTTASVLHLVKNIHIRPIYLDFHLIKKTALWLLSRTLQRQKVHDIIFIIIKTCCEKTGLITQGAKGLYLAKKKVGGDISCYSCFECFFG